MLRHTDTMGQPHVHKTPSCLCVLARSVCKILWLLCRVGSSHGCWQLIRPGVRRKGGSTGKTVCMWMENPQLPPAACCLCMRVGQVTNFDNVRRAVCIWRLHPTIYPPTNRIRTRNVVSWVTWHGKTALTTCPAES